MASTNTLTAQAATIPASTLNRPLTLLGIYTSANGARALVRKNGTNIMLDQDHPSDGLTLMGTGDGWAMVAEGDTLHRLVIS
ncbi:hypothetical protein [Pseudooctadecabacter jejudonensis]|uniref:Uncharacterized protein n=1 Tax=Pseudooctadecabacter jejudonensis TaxID=1391910 RepID=A0A1Y5T9E8_9RHOB|nr:hypothetical protein [Pseudooctadecabacter jejudonensis]SLN58655.1 hypothetical protein PSJ8397_03101 [Pseudooctadecabacter jejudonensis]